MTDRLLTRARHALTLPALPFVLILALGAFLRLYNFPGVPVGLDRDELSATYEAWSLLTRGTDRWGEAYPVYFLSWGSGQNVLYSYLSIPWVALFGLSTLAVRLNQVIFGILALPFLYLAVKRVFGRQVALISTLLLAVIPWGWIEARWGIESNLTPFFLLLTVYCLLRGLGVGNANGAMVKRRWIIIALIPAALTLYAYGLNLVPVAVILVLTLILYWRKIASHRQEWLVSVMIFLLLAVPFLLFFVKNYFPRDHALPFAMDGIFPFTFPELLVTRLAQVQVGTTHLDSVISNLTLIFHGFSLNHRFSDMFLPTLEPVPVLVGAFAVFGLIVRATVMIRKRKITKPNLFDFWVLGFLPLLALFPMSTTESQALVIPWLVYGAYGINVCYTWAKKRRAKLTRIVAGIALAAFVVTNVTVYFTEYQTSTYTKLFAERFSPQLDKQLPKADALAKKLDVPLYVSPRVNLGYMYTLWYLKIPSQTFDSYHPNTLNPDFGRYLFKQGDTDSLQKWVYLEPKVTAVGLTAPSCPNRQLVDNTEYWRLSVCSR